MVHSISFETDEKCNQVAAKWFPDQQEWGDFTAVTADEIVNHAILKGWTAFKASWSFDDLRGTSPPQVNGFRGKPKIDRFAADPELAQIRDQMKSGELQL